MGRINVYSQQPDEYADEQPQLLGWFDIRKCVARFDQGREWDGHNHIGVITRSQWVDESLFRTAGGRWVLNHDESRYHNGGETWRFLSDEEAEQWLIRSEVNDDAIERYFGQLPEEEGPQPEPEIRRGRPAIGDPVMVRYSASMLEQIDSAAQSDGLTRSEWLRRAAQTALAHYPPA